MYAVNCLRQANILRAAQPPRKKLDVPSLCFLLHLSLYSNPDDPATDPADNDDAFDFANHMICQWGWYNLHKVWRD
eukprot:11768219-Ditylum_brightwellii.AAC.1